MSDITLARAELASLLAQIAPVRTGRDALETTSATLPVIVLWSTGDTTNNQSGFTSPDHTRAITLEYKVKASAAHDDDLDTALSAIRSALAPSSALAALPHATALRETSARFFAPDLSQGGSDIAVLQINLEIDYLERF